MRGTSLMHRLLKVPILGRIIRIIISILMSPRRFDVLFNKSDLHQQALEDLQNQNTALRQQIADLSEQMQKRADEFELLNGQLRVHSRFLDHERDVSRMLSERAEQHETRQSELADRVEQNETRQSELADRIEQNETRQSELADRIEQHEARQSELSGRVDNAEHRLRQIGNVDAEHLKQIVNRLCASPDELKDLNRELSVHPTLWGSGQRLNIAKSAAVDTCLFNTNSGSITIGENTFAGSRVSLLAGSHDPHLQGFLRRDAELYEGCDIEIGNGVWLGSGCMLLGPCKVGDNAVIAAGAVVTPGTNVPANALFGGIPAKQIAELSFPDEKDAENPYILQALKRNNGLLFVDGWSEKKICPGIPCVGHWMTREKGVILVQKSAWQMFYTVRNVESCDLIFENESETLRITVQSGPLAIPLDLPVSDGETACFSVRLDNADGQLFMMLIERKD